MHLAALTTLATHHPGRPPPRQPPSAAGLPPDGHFVDGREEQRPRHEERLLGAARVAAQALKVALLVRRVLVDDEHVAPQAREDEACNKEYAYIQ